MVHPILGAKTTALGVYTGNSYVTDLGDLPLAAALHVETCVGQENGGFLLDTVGETKFVLENAKQIGKPVGVVAFVQLGRSDAGDIIACHKLAGGSAFRGIRMILNYSTTDPSLCWPQVGTDAYLKGTNEVFNKNFALLAQNGLTFDLHCNWFQLAEAASFLQKHGASTDVVLDHLGCLKLNAGADEDARRIEEWKRGMSLLASNPRMNVKISGLEYIKPGWVTTGTPERALIQDLVSFVVASFGTARCMVASNWPVDLAMGKQSLPELYSAIHELLASHSLEERKAMFYGNAMRVYGMDKLVAN